MLFFQMNTTIFESWPFHLLVYIIHIRRIGVDVTVKCNFFARKWWL